MPTNQLNEINKLVKARDDLTQEFGRFPKIEEMAEKAKVDLKEAKCVFRVANSPASLNHSANNSNGRSLGSLMPDRSEIYAHDVAINNELREILNKKMACLNYNERYVIECRYLADGERKTLQEIGGELGITRERVRQIENNALWKLGTGPFSDKLESFVLE